MGSTATASTAQEKNLLGLCHELLSGGGQAVRTEGSEKEGGTGGGRRWKKMVGGKIAGEQHRCRVASLPVIY